MPNQGFLFFAPPAPKSSCLVQIYVSPKPCQRWEHNIALPMEQPQIHSLFPESFLNPIFDRRTKQNDVMFTMAEVSQRASSFNKLKKILADVNTNATTPLTLSEVNHLMESSQKVMEKLEGYHDVIIALCTSQGAIDLQDTELAPMTDCYTKIRVMLMDIKEELIRANPTSTTAASVNGFNPWAPPPSYPCLNDMHHWATPES
ncbi:unnamed protein product [Orchesella dallaii]|uniref:Uncharacterized protein n=1 Tax=Orchesella dallaii TaxID=48710 RepID=A0ABP1RIC0_9HEXA